MRFLAALALSMVLGGWRPARAEPREYSRLVVLADPHLPGRNLELKRKALEDINAWEDVDGVAVLGDVCAGLGTEEEYSFAKEYFSRLKKPLFPVPGNHDYIYDKDPQGRTDQASPAVREAKLRRFRETFSLPAMPYAEGFGRYRLLFLPADDLHSTNLSSLSPGSLDWLKRELEAHREKPTLVFFHAPLEGTLRSLNSAAEAPRFIAQPKAEIREILRANPQVFVWASGHTHVAPSNAKYSHPVNVYEGRVTNIHNCDMDGRSYLSSKSREIARHGGLWSNSLYLYADRVVLKTYDHRKGVWLEKLDRTIRPSAPRPP